ncbi:MAG: hypothetical protein ABIF77_18030 [bacterium]
MTARIQDRRSTEIEASPEQVFAQIEIDPFPTFAILDTAPFLFLRLALLDGIGTARRTLATRSGSRDELLPLELGATMGPFTVTEKRRPQTFYFTLRSLFFKCRTGFSLRTTPCGTLLSFDTIAETPTRRERIWWFIVKPAHVLLARRVLGNIRRRALGS